MSLPLALEQALIHIVDDRTASLAKSTRQLSARYLAGEGSHALTKDEALAYVVARVPATYGAARAALEALKRQTPDLSPTSLLDVGSGPGTMLYAAMAVFPSVHHLAALEREPAMLAVGQRLLQLSQVPWEDQVSWVGSSFDARPLPDADLVTAGYLLNELSEEAFSDATLRLWQAARQALVIVEPGTPRAFERLRIVRRLLLDNGASLAAPCPHDGVCPIADGDWCHFAVRIPRSRVHRHAKNGAAPYEDEKYAYLALLKNVPRPRPARVIRHPQVKPGHIDLTLCTAAGIERRTVTKRHRDQFRQARKTRWGDPWIDDEEDR